MKEEAGSRIMAFEETRVDMNPSSPEDDGSFEIRFFLEDRQHGGRWTWPLNPLEKKPHIWRLHGHLGSGVGQPRLEDTWPSEEPESARP